VAALITPEQLIVYLDLPADTQPTDRAQLACDLLIDAVTEVAGPVLVEPYPAGVKSVALVAAGRLYKNPTLLAAESVDDYAFSGAAIDVLTEAEQAKIRRSCGSGGRPLYSFPEPDWSWTSVGATALTD
jgi:hypothetical protein